MYDSIKTIRIVVVHVLQTNISSTIETAASDIQFPVEVTGSHMRPVVVLETLDVTR